jgi:predicted RNase H-like nuclease (RuvC/YqgF family)
VEQTTDTYTPVHAAVRAAALGQLIVEALERQTYRLIGADQLHGNAYVFAKTFDTPSNEKDRTMRITDQKLVETDEYIDVLQAEEPDPAAVIEEIEDRLAELRDELETAKEEGRAVEELQDKIEELEEELDAAEMELSTYGNNMDWTDA